MRLDLLHDSWVIFVKEWREWNTASKMGLVLLGAVILSGAAALHLWGYRERSPLMVGVLLASLPLVLSAILIVESLAGERKRRTLEMLLASRLSEQAILLGKMSAAIVLGWIFLLAAAMPVMLQRWLAPSAGFERIDPASLLWGGLFVGASCIVLVVVIGATIALYVPSTRFSLFLTTVFGGVLVLGAFRAVLWQPNGSGELRSHSFTLIGLAILALAITLALLLLCSARRERMIRSMG